MAEVASRSTLAHQGPNKEPYWNRHRSNQPVASAPALDLSRSPNAENINFQRVGSSPSSMSLFERVSAAQKLRREAKEPQTAVQAMRQGSETSFKTIHAALAEYRSAVEGNGVPHSVKQK